MLTEMYSRMFGVDVASAVLLRHVRGPERFHCFDDGGEGGDSAPASPKPAIFSRNVSLSIPYGRSATVRKGSKKRRMTERSGGCEGGSSCCKAPLVIAGNIVMRRGV